MNIRAAELDDSASIAELMTQLGYPTTPDVMRARLRAILERDDYHTVVAEIDGTIAGVAGMCVMLSYDWPAAVGRLLVLVVNERQRGHGVGAALVHAAENWLWERNASVIVINSGSHRHDAHRFYQSHGYTQTGIRLVKLPG